MVPCFVDEETLQRDVSLPGVTQLVCNRAGNYRYRVHALKQQSGVLALYSGIAKLSRDYGCMFS